MEHNDYLSSFYSVATLFDRRIIIRCWTGEKEWVDVEISIRNENEADYRLVEELTREAFWNLYVPGCDEHYLVHIMRTHPDFLSQLDFVATYENKIIGNIMYVKSHVIDLDDSTRNMDTITFGPVSVLPQFQRQGVGSRLIRYSIEKATEQGYTAVIVQGYPRDYCRHGFKSAKDLRICDSEGRNPYSLLALALKPGVFEGFDLKYIPSSVYDIDQRAVDSFDKQFEYKERQVRHSQEEFSIASRAYLM